MSHADVTPVNFSCRYGNIAGLRWGQGQPILALHGWLDNAASFSHMAPLLAQQGFEVTAIDFPGHGHSDHRAVGHNYAFIDYVLDLQAVMAQLSQPITLIGHSMGGAIATLYAAAYPEHVKQLVVIENMGPVPPHEPGKAKETLRHALDLWQKHSLEHKRFYPDTDSAIANRQQATPLPTDIIRPMVERGLKQSDQGLHWRTDKRLRLRSLFRIAESQIQEYLTACEVPTQLIVGTPRTYALDYPMYEARLAALNPDQFIELPGGHHLHMDQAESVAKTIETFLTTGPDPIADNES